MTPFGSCYCRFPRHGSLPPVSQRNVGRPALCRSGPRKSSISDGALIHSGKGVRWKSGLFGNVNDRDLVRSCNLTKQFCANGKTLPMVGKIRYEHCTLHTAAWPGSADLDGPVSERCIVFAQEIRYTVLTPVHQCMAYTVFTYVGRRDQCMTYTVCTYIGRRDQCMAYTVYTYIRRHEYGGPVIRHPMGPMAPGINGGCVFGVVRFCTRLGCRR